MAIKGSQVGVVSLHEDPITRYGSPRLAPATAAPVMFFVIVLRTTLAPRESCPASFTGMPLHGIRFVTQGVRRYQERPNGI